MRKRLSLTLLCLFFTLQAFATDWVLPAQTIDAAHFATFSGSIAIDQNGNAHAVWIGDLVPFMPTTTANVYYSKRPFEGTWSTPFRLSEGNVFIDTSEGQNIVNAPQIVVTRDGGVVVTWATGTAESQDVQARVFNRHIWTEITTLTTMPSQTNVDPKLAIVGGNLIQNIPPFVVIIWVQYDGTGYQILSNTLDSSRHWTMPVEVEFSTDALDQIQFTSELGGIFTAIWRDFDGSNSYSIRASSRGSFDPTWSAPQTIASSSSTTLRDPAIALNNGTALAIWVEEGATMLSPDIVSTAFGNPLSNTWNAPTNMITTELKAGLPQVGIDSAGYAVAIWENATMSAFGVAASTYSPTMGWAVPTTLSSNNTENPPPAPQLGLDGTGNAIAVWTDTSASNGTVISRTLPFNGAWEAPIPLNTPTDPISGAFPLIAVNTNGLAAALWFNVLMTSSSVQSAVTEMPDSPCATCPNPISPSTPVTMWFVNNANPVAGNGSYNNPYKNLHTTIDASHPCDVIYVFPGNGPYDPIDFPFLLLDNQRLLGTTLEAFQRCPETEACNLPLLTQVLNSSSPTILATADNNQISGFHIQNHQVPISNIGIICFNSHNLLVTDNIFTIYAGQPDPNTGLPGSAILIQNQEDFSSTPTGEFTITNCIFQAANNTSLSPADGGTTGGILIGGTNEGLFTIDNNLFTYLDIYSGFIANVALTEVQGSKVLIRNNRMFNQLAPQNVEMMGGSPVTTPILAEAHSGFGETRTPLSIIIENNEIHIDESNFYTSILEGIAVGIDIHMAGISSVCATLDQNSVSLTAKLLTVTEGLVGGYTFGNQSPNPFFLDFDSSNRGTVQIDNDLLHPIFLTSDCP